jgi:exodeoxyribonuclease V alpha subunit
MAEILEWLYQKGLIDALDLEFARFMGELANDDSRELLLGCALASRAVGQGDVCLVLPQYAGQMLVWPELDRNAVFAPELNAWRRVLRRSRVIGKPGEFQPLVLDGQDRLYLYRYWNYENQLAAELRQRARQVYEVDEARLRADLQRLFPPQNNTVMDWQKVAAALAVLRGFSVISGGPGTGKTTTLAKILALFIEQMAGKVPRIHLAAPTGKAAARMQEAIRASKEKLAGVLAPAILAAIPEEASTLHRLLGAQPDGVYFRHNRDNPLSLDVLVIDEASMVDLALITKVVWALPPHGRLILLGDKDQLSSVEAGTVLGELCAQVGGYSPHFAQRLAALTGETLIPGDPVPQLLQDSIALLQHSYRFGGDSGIGRLAEAVNRGDEQAIQTLRSQPLADVDWCSTANLTEQTLLERMLQGYGPYLQQVRGQAPVAQVFTAFQEYQVLCPQRTGPTGVETLNAQLENLLKSRLRRTGSEWYPGRPVMITRNDYQLRLFNGDIGIALPDPEREDRLRVYFQETDGGLRSFPITRLPAYEPVFAMTIHKSQGSEFDAVLLVLPAEDSRVMTRELIYTGITRARKRIAIWGSLEIMLLAVRKLIRRSSGLQEKLQV